MSSRRKNVPGERPTLSQIAEKIGVSTATVSLAMKENSRISDDMRAKVMKVMRETGYVYRRSAAGLRTSRTYTVGIILNNIYDPFFGTLLGHVERSLGEKGLTAFLCNTDEDVKRQRDFIVKMSEYNAEGILLVPAMGTTAEEMQALESVAPPIACMSRTIPGYRIDSVVVDAVKAAEISIKMLADLGHRRIALVGGTDGLTPHKDWLAGYRQGLSAAGLSFDPDLVIKGRPVREMGLNAAEKLLMLPNPPTAAVCYNSIVTLGLNSGLHRAGIAVGKDFSLIGNEDIEEMRLARPSLSTTSVDVEVLARQVVKRLLRRMSDPMAPIQNLCLVPDLLMRESCGRAPRQTEGG